MKILSVYLVKVLNFKIRDRNMNIVVIYKKKFLTSSRTDYKFLLFSCQNYGDFS